MRNETAAKRWGSGLKLGEGHRFPESHCRVQRPGQPPPYVIVFPMSPPASPAAAPSSEPEHHAPAIGCARIAACVAELRRFGYECECELPAGAARGVHVVCVVRVDELGMDAGKLRDCGFVPGGKVLVAVGFHEGYRSLAEWEESAQVSLAVRVVDGDDVEVASVLQPGLDAVLRGDGFREMARCRVEMDISWEDAFCLTKGIDKGVVEDSVKEMCGEREERGVERENLCLLALRWVRREIYCRFTRCVSCRVPIAPGMPGGGREEEPRIHVCGDEKCARYGIGTIREGRVCVSSELVGWKGGVEAEILRDPLAADLCISICYATLFEEPSSNRGRLVAEFDKMREMVERKRKLDEAASGSGSPSDGDFICVPDANDEAADLPPLPLVVMLDPTPPEMSSRRIAGAGSLRLDDREVLWRSKKPALTKESYEVLRKVIFSLPKMDVLYAVCRGSGRLRDYLAGVCDPLAYDVLCWILSSTTRALRAKLKFSSNEGDKIRKCAGSESDAESDPSVEYPKSVLSAPRLYSGGRDGSWLTTSFQFLLEPDESARGTTVNPRVAQQQVANGGSLFAYHGSALGRWWSILHNKLDGIEVENGRAY